MVACIPSLPLAAASKVLIIKLFNFYSTSIRAGIVESIHNLHFVLPDPLFFCHLSFVGVPNMPGKSQLQNSGKPNSSSFKYFKTIRLNRKGI